MFTFSKCLSVGLMALALTACTSIDGGNQSMTDAASRSSVQTVNVLLAPWTGPHGGVPPFDRVKLADFKPALEKGMAEKRAEYQAIADSTAAPTFENTVARLEDSGRALSRVMTVYQIWAGTMSSPEFQAIEKEMSAPLAAFEDEMIQNEKLFKRLEAVYLSPDLKKLTPEQQRLTWKYYRDWVRAGAKLDDSKKKRLSSINQRLADVFTQFRQNLLADESTFILLENEKDQQRPRPKAKGPRDVGLLSTPVRPLSRFSPIPVARIFVRRSGVLMSTAAITVGHRTTTV